MTQPPVPPPAAPSPSASPTLTIDLAKLPTIATALGVSLVSAAIVMSSTYSREDHDLDVSNFVMGVLAALGLLAIAAAAQVLVKDPVRREMLMSWPGAFGAAGVGSMLATLITDHKVAEHVAPLAALAIAVVGYLLTRSAPFVLVALGSLAILYARFFDDLFSFNTGDGDTKDNTFMLIGAGVLVFVVAATALGWLFPLTRVLTGVVTGLGGLIGMAGLLLVAATFRSISHAFYGVEPAEDGSGSFQRSGGHVDDPFKNDVYMIMLYCLALAAIWAVASLRTGHIAFRLLLLADVVVIVPLSSFATLTRHPTWWEVVTCALGGLVLAALGARALRPTPPAPSAFAPPPADLGQ